MQAESPVEPATNTLRDEIRDYWDKRSATYSASVLRELGGPLHEAWAARFRKEVPELGTCDLRAADMGCGPGFFSILMAEAGCMVDAVDGSPEMLGHARSNVEACGLGGRVTFHQGDVCASGLASGSYDLIAMRDLTWTMLDPLGAYREWHHLLAPGGRLLVFDSNWYRYLVDPRVRRQREADQRDRRTLQKGDDSRSSEQQEARCEAIARDLPLTGELRPAWDERVLGDIGFSHVEVCADVWRELWTPGEQRYYASSPMFLVVATK